jgi:hypothetical protein
VCRAFPDVTYAQANCADAPFYLFEPDMASDADRAAMAADYSTPAPFTDDLYRYHRPMMPCHAYLIVGSNRTGSNVHVDPSGTAAWNTLLCGRKKWCLFPPGNEPSYLDQIGATAGYKTTPPLYWWLDVYPTIDPSLGMIEVKTLVPFLPAGVPITCVTGNCN